VNKKEFKQFLYDICGDCECHSKDDPYCTLIEFLVEAHQSHRLLMQMKCVEKWKYEMHKDMSWGDAFQLWVESGMAKKFGDMYSEEIKFRELYKKIVGRNGNGNGKSNGSQA